MGAVIQADDAGARGAHARARWPADLGGKTLGLLDNTKAGAAQILDQLAERLTRDAGDVRIVRVRKAHPSTPMSDADRDALLGSDAVITGLGD